MTSKLIKITPWSEALKEYRKQNPDSRVYIPRKGTEQYNATKLLEEEIASGFFTGERSQKISKRIGAGKKVKLQLTNAQAHCFVEAKEAAKKLRGEKNECIKEALALVDLDVSSKVLALKATKAGLKARRLENRGLGPIEDEPVRARPQRTPEQVAARNKLIRKKKKAIALQKIRDAYAESGIDDLDR